MRPNFSVITPSFRQLEWLRLCAASVADQQGVTVEHIVQDAGTGPELEAWAASQQGLTLYVEKDGGMYDAINRGLRKAQGEIIAYLNCDEQYLPGTLGAVREYFGKHPEIDVVFGDAIVVDGTGDYLCSRRILVPTLYHTWVCTLSIFTAATFFRRSVVEERGLFFSEEFKVLGDAVWVLDLIRRGVRMGSLGTFASVFADTGANLSADPRMRSEQQRILGGAPWWAKKLSPLWSALSRLRRLRQGHYRPKPVSYSIYTREQPERRKEFVVNRPTFRWKSQFDSR